MEIVALLTVQVIFGVSYLVGRELLQVLDPFVMIFLRCLFAWLLLSLILRRYRIPKVKLDMPTKWKLAFLGIAANQIFFALGLKHSAATEVAIVVTSVPVWTYATALLIGSERFRWRPALGILLTATGLVLLFGRPQGSASVFNLLNSFSYALYFALAREHMRDNNPLALIKEFFKLGTALTFVALVVAALVGYADLSSAQSLAHPTTWLLLAYIVIPGSVGTYSLNAFAARALPASALAIAMTLQPVVTGIIEYFVHDFAPSPMMAVSAIIVVTGIFLAARRDA